MVWLIANDLYILEWPAGSKLFKMMVDCPSTTHLLQVQQKHSLTPFIV